VTVRKPERTIGLEPDEENERPTTTQLSKPKPKPKPSSSPARPEQSAEDTDSSWGERPEPTDDERLYGDRPPHWDSP
jgi:hypothetical protein